MVAEPKQSSSNSAGNTIYPLTSIRPPKGYDYVELVYKYGQDRVSTTIGFQTDETPNKVEYTIDETPILAALSQIDSHIVHGLRVLVANQSCIIFERSCYSVQGLL